MWLTMQIQELSNRILPLQDKGHWKNSMSNSINIDNVKDTVMLIVYLCQTLMLLELSDCCGTAEAVDLREILIELNEYLIFFWASCTFKICAFTPFCTEKDCNKLKR